jgi:hypothetical protein
VSIWRKRPTKHRIALRLENGWLWVEIGEAAKPLLKFPVGNFDYVRGRGEPLFLDNPDLVERVKSLIAYSRASGLSSLPDYVWHPVTTGDTAQAPLLDRILLFFLSRDEIIAIPGDIQEKLPEVLALLGPRGARLWCRKELFAAVVASVSRRLEPLFRFIASLLRHAGPFN